MEIRKLDETYIEHTYHRHTPILMRGKGCTVYDSEGKAYVDLSAGITVNSLGFSDPAWQTAVMSQLLQLQHASNRYYTAPQVLLAEQLCKRTGMQKAVFGNSGTEANECAIKLARKWGIDRHGADCYHIITLENSFHGHTLGALAAAGQPALKADFGPVLPGFHHVPANDLAAMQAAFAQYPVAGVMLELVQSEDGMKALDADYVQALCALCREKDALLIVDEVQTGNGRTGALYAYELFGIAPDVVTTANGLAGGLPIGVTLIGARAAGTLTRGTHSSTFGGNPVCAAAARAVLSRIDGALLQAVVEKGEYIKTQLQGAKGVKAVTGLGLLIGVLPEARLASDVAEACEKHGVLLLTEKDSLCIAPALNIPMEELAAAIAVVKQELAAE